MHRALIGLGLATALLGCGDVYTLNEAEGSEVVEATLTARGYAPTDRSFTLEEVPLCDAFENCQAPVTLTLDGWDPVNRIGFEYVGETDPDFVRHPLVNSTNPAVAGVNTELLEAAINARLAEGDGGTVLVFRNWGHETEGLARGQLERAVERRMDEHALTGP